MFYGCVRILMTFLAFSLAVKVHLVLCGSIVVVLLLGRDCTNVCVFGSETLCHNQMGLSTIVFLEPSSSFPLLLVFLLSLTTSIFAVK